MADRVDPTMEVMQSASSDAMANAMLVEPSGAQLPDGDDTVLTSSDLGDNEIRPGTLVAHTATKGPRTADSPPVRTGVPATSVRGLPTGT